MNENELVAIEKMDIVSFFTKDDDMDKILKRIRDASCRDLIQNCDTEANRKAIASMAYRVAQSKVMLEKAGKDLVSEWKEKTKKIDVSRKRARDYLDDLRDEIRFPLTKWEMDEKARIEKEKAAAELAEAWDAAHAEHELFLRQEAIENKEAELAKRQAEKEAEIAEKQAELIKAQAEKRAAELQKKHDEQVRQEAIEQAKKAEVSRRNQEAADRRNLIIQAEQEKAEKERQFKIEKEQALADLSAKIEKEKKAEIAKLEKAKAIAEKKAANITHQKKINNIVLKGLMNEGLTEAKAKDIIGAIVKNKIKHVTINY